MYNYIRGIVTEKFDNVVRQITIETNNIGFAVIPTAKLFCMVEIGEVVTVHTYLHVREDAHTLYGFSSAQERKLFMQLLGVGGVGAKSAINLLELECDNLASAIAGGNTNFIATAKGVSKKTAEKIVLELGDKVEVSGASQTPMQFRGMQSEIRDALDGLANLGLSKAVANELINMVDTKDKSAEDIIVLALSMRGRK